jgi:Rod binding domain-containing protein
MNSISLQSIATTKVITPPTKPTPPSAKAADNPALRKAFDQFVGQTFYGQMLKSMRKSQGKPAYFNGGRAEEVFTQQLDQAFTKKLSETSSGKLSGPMYNLFTQQRK